MCKNGLSLEAIGQAGNPADLKGGIQNDPSDFFFVQFVLWWNQFLFLSFLRFLRGLRAKSVPKILHPNHDRAAFHGRQPADFFQGADGGAVGGAVKHED
jgi:hypothetical protein